MLTALNYFKINSKQLNVKIVMTLSYFLAKAYQRLELNKILIIMLGKMHRLMYYFLTKT